jgi:parallel beta-helix repeat protein
LIHLPYSGLFKMSWISLKLVASDRSPYLFIKVLLFSVFRSSVLFFAISLGLTAVVMENLEQQIAVAQTPQNLQKTPVVEKTMSQVQTLFVNPSIGDDKTGDGSDRTPFKTITQALQNAKLNTVISLSKGTYSQEAGESFPLILKPGVTLQGDPATKGRGIIIQGGDDYLSRSYGKQNITIVGANESNLVGVTVTNPNPRGYGMWIESVNTTVSENTFVGSTQDGISVTGDGTAVITKNYFYRNGANGMTISGHARPEVRENTFQQTGFGINIAQSAQPTIINNQIQYNRAGVIVQANARPILRSNLIQGNREDGLVAIAQAMPDLGTATEAGGNEFRNNVRYDINATANKEVFSAYGNIIKNDAPGKGRRIAGKVDIGGNTALIPQTTSQASKVDIGGNTTLVTQTTKVGTNEITFTNPNLSNNTPKTLGRVVTPNIPKQPLESKIVPSPNTVSTSPPQVTPKPSNLGNSPWQPSPTGELPQINYTNVSPGVIEFTAPPPPNSATTPQSGDAAKLMPTENNPNNNQNRQVMAYGTNPTSTNPTSAKLLYRIIVPAGSDRDAEIIRFLSPTAFRTVWKGQEVIQVGSFSSAFNAEQMLRILNNNGLKGTIETSN